jgi:hypothetical protein
MGKGEMYLGVSKAPLSTAARISPIDSLRRNHFSNQLIPSTRRLGRGSYLLPSKDEGSGVFDILLTYMQRIDARVESLDSSGCEGRVVR